MPQGCQCGHSRFRCKDCGRIFKTEYVYRAYEPGVKDQLVEMAMNGSGIRDTARVLGIGKGTVIAALKKVRRSRHRESLYRCARNRCRSQASLLFS